MQDSGQHDITNEDVKYRETQIERIRKRNPEKVQRFIEEWIPYEELYFREFDTEKQADSVIDTKVEVQIRTVAMDFWASLEHKMNYKFDMNAPEEIKKELYECAQMVSALDERMRQLNEEIREAKKNGDVKQA